MPIESTTGLDTIVSSRLQVLKNEAPGAQKQIITAMAAVCIIARDWGVGIVEWPYSGVAIRV